MAISDRLTNPIGRITARPSPFRKRRAGAIIGGMKLPLALAAAALCAAPAFAQDGRQPPPAPQSEPTPKQIADSAPAAEWTEIAPEDLMIITLAPTETGEERQIVIRLMSAPFAQGWVDNLRLLTKTRWYDGLWVYRLVDNFVVQWGDPASDPDAGETPRPLPDEIVLSPESDYVHHTGLTATVADPCADDGFDSAAICDNFAPAAGFREGWPVAWDDSSIWPIHCYGMVGVGRNESPDTGTGSELYAIIGHAPRRLDRNLALVGRVIEGMDHFAALPRGHGRMNTYKDKNTRTLVVSVRLASELEDAPRFEYLSTEGESFARMAKVFATGTNEFYTISAGDTDVCAVPLPVRRVSE